MRPAPRQPGHGPMQPMGMSEYDDQQANGGQFQQGVVMMVYGLNADKMNCQRMFNLFCVFGNVVRVSFRFILAHLFSIAVTLILESPHLWLGSIILPCYLYRQLQLLVMFLFQIL